jgi:hypothetical protein
MHVLSQSIIDELDITAAQFYTDKLGGALQALNADIIPSSMMRTFTAPGDIFPDK